MPPAGRRNRRPSSTAIYRRGSEPHERSAEAGGIFNRVRPKRQVELQRRPWPAAEALARTRARLDAVSKNRLAHPRQASFIVDRVGDGSVDLLDQHVGIAQFADAAPERWSVVFKGALRAAQSPQTNAKLMGGSGILGLQYGLPVGNDLVARRPHSEANRRAARR